MDKVIEQVITDEYAIYNGDCIELIKNIETGIIGHSIFSPPFASLYTYSNSDRDMGNVKSYDEFFKHFSFLTKELYRVMMPGRLVAIHCMNLPTSKQNDGYIGIRDFRGDLIREFQKQGFIYHSETCIWKDPVVAMQRTKAKGLLHKQIKKDSACSRMGLPDYLVVMGKPGENNEPISGEFKYYTGDQKLNKFIEFNRDDGRNIQLPKGGTSIDVWQNYASPVWFDISQSDTLQFREARENDDERHICPLQLDVIERSLQLWSNPGDLVLTPFMGIGSETYMAVKMKRKGIGFELKNSYFKLAEKNMILANSSQYDLFNQE